MEIEDVKTNEDILAAIKDQPVNNNASKALLKYKDKTYTLISFNGLTRQYLISNNEIHGDPGFWVSEKHIKWSTNDLN